MNPELVKYLLVGAFAFPIVVWVAVFILDKFGQGLTWLAVRFGEWVPITLMLVFVGVLMAGAAYFAHH